jgi:hypothetical protein
MPQAPDQHLHLPTLSFGLRCIAARAIGAVLLAFETASFSTMEPADTLAPHRWLAARFIGDSGMGMASPCGSRMG